VRIDILSKEYPPAIYGGAGVHVAELVRALRERGDLDVRVHAFGEPREEDGTTGHPDLVELAGANPALVTLGVDLTLAAACAGADLVHSHTWYANMGGHLAALMGDIPHVLSAHSLEPMRPWKAEQLGGGYRVSSWVEKTAVEAADGVIAVSSGMRDDVLHTYPGLDPNRVHVVRNGIDTDVWYPAEPDPSESVLAELGVDVARPIVAFVGRITRQKGVAHLIAAAHQFAPEIQLVLCAGAPDTPEIAAEVTSAVQELARSRSGVFWVREMLPVGKIRGILSAATVFVCPSVYEPLGIVNLEAMACATAVVASDVGGIPEVVADRQTGLLVHYDASDPEFYERRLAEAVNSLVAEPDKARQYGQSGRQRCIQEFSWAHIAEQTLEIYRKVSS
jgi:alpha-maltose-1-phosphate synthase